MTPEQLLRVFHDETRAPIRLGTAQRPIEVDGLIRREYDVDGGQWNMVESPDGLGPQRDFFADRGLQVEWKTYDYDEPADLGERLLRAGFVKEDDEALILGEAAPLAAQDIRLPDGVTVRAAATEDDFARIRTMLEAVWGKEQSWVTESLLPTWQRDPRAMDVVVIEESQEGPVRGPERVRRERLHGPVGWLDARRVAGPRPLPRDPAPPGAARARPRQGLRARRRLAGLRADPASAGPAPSGDDDSLRLPPPRHLSWCP